MAKVRIAILGSGPAALATAYELTRRPDFEERFEIDIYAMGWRLGGKCASSRGEPRGRNEEHGLHILGGFYHACFEQLHDVYREWQNVSQGTAIAYADAFFPHQTFTLLQRDLDRWRPVRVKMPDRDGIPGIDADNLSAVGLLERFLRLLRLGGDKLIDHFHSLADAEMMTDGDGSHGSKRAEIAAETASTLISAYDIIESYADALQGDEYNRFSPPDSSNVEAAISEIMVILDSEWPQLRNLDWLGALQLGLSIANGILSDKVLVRGFDAINDVEASAWLKKHGATERALRSILFKAGYHYAFGYPGGDALNPNIAAGAGMRGLIRMVAGYHQSVFMHMRGGMGEIFVTPYFEVLRHRGVNFHFFHMTEELIPGDDGTIDKIVLRRQVRLADETIPYDPIVEYTPRGMPSRNVWPSQAQDDQLHDDDKHVPRQHDLESWYDSQRIGESIVLQRGECFDICVLAIPVGTVVETTKQLAVQSPRWRKMLETASTTPTIGVQIWHEQERGTFGGYSHDELMTGFHLPMDTWCDMSQLLELEQPDNRIGALSYFCGSVPRLRSSPPTDRGAERRRGEAIASAWLNDHAAAAFPSLGSVNGEYNQAAEVDRFVSMNSDPATTYVTTPVGNPQHRIRPDETGFANLFLAGDWTRNNFDMGAVECAVLSAKLCARAISGDFAPIFGESDFV